MKIKILQENYVLELSSGFVRTLSSLLISLLINLADAKGHKNTTFSHFNDIILLKH